MDWIGMRANALEKLRKYRYALLILLAGILLMSVPEGKNRETETAPPPVEAAQQDLQEELASLLARVEGAGRVEVLLTRSAGERTLYQTDDDVSAGASSQDTRRKTVLVTDGSREQGGLVSQVLPPVYRGAVILCQGAENARVRLAIVEAVSNATGLSTDKISVLKMK